MHVPITIRTTLDSLPNNRPPLCTNEMDYRSQLGIGSKSIHHLITEEIIYGPHQKVKEVLGFTLLHWPSTWRSTLVTYFGLCLLDSMMLKSDPIHQLLHSSSSSWIAYRLTSSQIWIHFFPQKMGKRTH